MEEAVAVLHVLGGGRIYVIYSWGRVGGYKGLVKDFDRVIGDGRKTIF